MELKLDDVEIRVIGALIEKELTTPDYYPLSLNALVNACNQLTNREPVVSYDEETVRRALESLREKKCARVVIGSDSRVPKYQQVFTELLDLALQEVAVICVLMLRGAQTAGELRARTNRLYNFGSLEEVELTVQGLVERSAPLIMRLPRQPGTKESRYAHLIGGEVEVEAAAAMPVRASKPDTAANQEERIAQLEAETAALRSELNELKDLFERFKSQFE